MKIANRYEYDTQSVKKALTDMLWHDMDARRLAVTYKVAEESNDGWLKAYSAMAYKFMAMRKFYAVNDMFMYNNLTFSDIEKAFDRVKFNKAIIRLCGEIDTDEYDTVDIDFCKSMIECCRYSA